MLNNGKYLIKGDKMASYSASMITVDIYGNPITAGGSFGNISIDGRLSLACAIEIARDSFKKEADFKHANYQGFAIEKTTRFVDYRNPVMVDTQLKAADVTYLLS